jgi:hypothetical protein
MRQILLILLCVSIAFCAGKQVEKGEEWKISEVESAKTLPPLAETFLPQHHSWPSMKGDESSGMFYPSSLPRKPEVKFKVSRETYQSSFCAFGREGCCFRGKQTENLRPNSRR